MIWVSFFDDDCVLVVIVVIGMGWLGGVELGYGLDVDVMFVCELVIGVDDVWVVKWLILIVEWVWVLLGIFSVDLLLEFDVNL